MVKIRLAREGKRNDPFYRIVAVESTKKRSGGFLEILGHWHPREEKLDLDNKRLKHWVSNGAQMSQAVKELTEK